MKSFLVKFGGVAVVSFVLGYSAQAGQKLFTLERSNNSNQVVYELDSSNALAPIHPYWIMRETDSHIEELTGMERRRAYGVQFLSQGAEGLKFTIVSFPSKPITVKTDSGKSYAVMSINGADRILTDVFLTLSGGLIPGVKTVDLYYKDSLSGPVLRYSFNP